MIDYIGIAAIIGAAGTVITPIVVAVLTRQQNRKIEASAENVRKIEIATNSMKDALVAATAKASKAEGKAEGVEQGRNEKKEEKAQFTPDDTDLTHRIGP